MPTPRRLEPLPLGHALEFLRALWAIDHGLARRSSLMERTMGVTGPQRLAIRLIGRAEGIEPAELATLMHVHRSAISGIVRRLLAKRLVSRRVHAHDARRWVLSLTAAGARVDRLDRGTIESRIAQVLEVSAPDEIGAAMRLLERLAGALAVEG